MTETVHSIEPPDGPPRTEPVPGPDDRVITGFAAQLAARLGVPPVYVRAGFVSLTSVWGIGLVLYLAGMAATAGASGSPLPTIEHASDDVRRHRGLAMIGLSVLLVLRALGIWPGDVVVWPVTALAFGAAFLIDQRDIDSRQAIQGFFDPADGTARRRTLIGVALTIFGLAMLGGAAVPQVGVTVLAVLVTGAGFVVLFGPWMWRLVGALGEERNERIRQEERAEMAAHLHDSVLQTLALIQRTDDPRRMTTLARSQERELRRWLYDKTPHSADDLLSDALTSVAARIEEDFDVPVEVVTVGDVTLDEELQPLVRAAGEALTNAAKHAKADRISLYSEITDELVEIFVTDQGVGFDRSAVDPERRGISDSIEARMTRHGGSGQVWSDPGEGTEVYLSMPRSER